jgi:hypothetical protein
MRRIQTLLLLPLALLSASCQTIVTQPPANCLSFIPESWWQGIEPAEIPESSALPAWMQFGVEQSGNLSKSNARLGDVRHILGTCESNVNEARPRKKFLGIF